MKDLHKYASVKGLSEDQFVKAYAGNRYFAVNKIDIKAAYKYLKDKEPKPIKKAK